MTSQRNERDIKTVAARLSSTDTTLPAKYWISAKRAYQKDCRAIRSMGIDD